MPTMPSINLNVLDWANADAAERERVLTRNGTQQGLTRVTDLNRSIAELVEHVRRDGDAALVAALRTFDGVEATPDTLRVGEDEFEQARAELSDDLIEAIRVSIARSRVFNEAIVERASWSMPGPDGTNVGEVARPIDSVGLFVPSGKGSYPSVLIQIGTPAVVAGVSRIAVVVPPNPTPGGTRVDAATLVVAEELGIKEVYCLNGPSGVAALAIGTETVPAVGKIVGPGSPAVTIAQQLVQSMGVQVAPGLGPTDSLIIADSTADPVTLAADFLNEAEHGADSSAVLVSTDRGLLEQVAKEVESQWRDLPDPRRGYAENSICDNGGLVLAASDEQTLEIANAYASEHVQLAVADPQRWLAGVRHAGTVLIGQWTPFSASNFSIGTPATLPTTGFAKSVSGVTAHTYLTTIATAALTENDFWTIAPAIEALATHEGFPAHLASVTTRRRLHDRPVPKS
jgi:histidinol dehydrogenase